MQKVKLLAFSWPICWKVSSDWVLCLTFIYLFSVLTVEAVSLDPSVRPLYPMTLILRQEYAILTADNDDDDLISPQEIWLVECCFTEFMVATMVTSEAKSCTNSAFGLPWSFFLPLSSNGITQENTRDWKTLIKTQAFQHAHDVCFGDCYYISWVRAVTQTKARFNFQLSTKNIIGLRFALHEFQQHLCSCRGILCSWLAGMWGKTCWTFCQEFGLFMQDLFIGSSDASVLLLGFRYRYLYKAVIPLWLIFS